MANKRTSVRKPTKPQRRAYRNLYMKVYRKRKQKDELEEGKGYNTRRTEFYKELVELNRQLLDYGKKIGIKSAKRKKKTDITEPEYDVDNKVSYYTENSWKFQKILKKYIDNKEFKFVYINGVKIKVKGTPPHVIYHEYDKARDNAYSMVMASTPNVNIMEDYEDGVLEIEFVS